MKLVKSIVAIAAAMVASVGNAGDSAPFRLDTKTAPMVNSLSVSWDASWIGGDANATVVITDNGTEVKRTTGTGEFTYALTGGSRHELTYTTYINGVEQREVYTAAAFKDWKYEIQDGGAVITGAAQTSGDLTIPAEIDGNSVVAVGAQVFAGCTSLTSVTIPSNVTSIGSYAFRDCSGLTSVTIPDSVTNVESYAFTGCSGVRSVRVPQCVCVNRMDSLFNDVCQSITNIIISDSVTSIGPLAFSGCSGLTSVTIPDSVTNVESYAFTGCSGVRSVRVPQCVCINRMDSLFNDVYQSITNIIISDSVTSIGDYAFSGCSGLTSVTIPDGVAKIGYKAFYGCSGLTSITIPDSLTSIGVDAFASCSGLTSVTMPPVMSEVAATQFFQNKWELVEVGEDGVEEYQSNLIGYGGSSSMSLDLVGPYEMAFKWKASCGYIYDSLRWSLDGVTKAVIRDTGGDWQSVSALVPEGEHTIRWTYTINVDSDEPFSRVRVKLRRPSAVATMSALFPDAYKRVRNVTLTGGATEIPAEAFVGCTNLTTVTIVDGVTSIGTGAFRGCSGLTSVTIPDSVMNIGGDAFYGCDRLAAVYITDLASWCYISFDGSSANPLNYAHKLYLNGSLVTDLTIPDGLTSIAAYAFSGCNDLAKVMIPSSVTNIGNYAFSGCSGLTSVAIPSSVRDVGRYAFNNCNHITDVVAPGWNCNIPLGAVTNLVIAEGTTSFDPAVFASCSNIKSVTVVGCMARQYTMSDLFLGCFEKIRYVYLAEDVSYLHDHFFDGCKALESLVFSGSVVDFGDNDMRWMIDRNAPNGLFIKDGWVFGWVGAEPSTLVIPDGVRGIAPYALCGLYDLESVQLPSTLKYIGAKAFAGDSYLDNVVIPDGVETIGEGAFEDCSFMQTLTIGNGVKKIGRRAFAGCTQLASAEFTDGLCEVGAEAFSNCWRMASVALPVTTTNVGAMAFADCSSLTGVTTPTRQGTMSEWFAGVYPNIQSVTVPEGETSVVDGMFEGCAALASLTLPDSITNIGERAFADCASLTAMAIPGNVACLGAGAFAGCSQIATMTLPNGLAELPDDVFAGCTSLDSFVVPASVTNIGSRIVSDSVEAIYYLGNAPAYAADAYASAGDALTSYVVRGTKGWDGRPTSRDIPQTWIGHDITTWEATRFDVTFNANGGKFMPEDADTFAREEITDTGYSLPPNEPVRPGYKFTGYWTALTGGSRVTSATRVTLTKAHTLYAQWRVGKKVTVRFNACGGTVSPGEGSYTSEASYGELPVPTREHFRFAGWWTVANGGTEVTIASEVPKADHELFAHWTPTPCIVRFHACNGTSETRDQEFVYGEPVTLDANAFTRDGYAFAGWATTEGGASVYPDRKTLEDVSGMQNDVLHLYATWVSTRYAVRFDSNGGVGRMDSQPFVRDVEANLVACAFTRTGYEFGGWAASSAGPVVYADGASVTNVYELTGVNGALYAVWVPIEYSISYDANGGAGEMSAQPMVYDVAAPLAYSAFTRPGSLFRGWATASDGAVAYREQASVMNLTAVADDVVTLYAVWQEKPASVLACEDAFGGAGTVTLDEDDNIVVTLTNDVSGTVEIPDNVGNVAIDLDGHSITGTDGGAAILVVAGDGDGDTTRLTIGDTSDGEKGQIVGGGASAGIAFADDAKPGVRLDVEDEVSVLNGDGSEQPWWELSPVEHTLKAGEYFKMTLAELGYEVPTNGTVYSVTAYGLPAGLQLKYNAAVKDKKGKVIKKAKCEWWIEGVPTAALDFFTTPPYLVITVNGNTEPLALPVEVVAQKVTDLGELSLGESVNTNGWLVGVGKGWTVTGLPTGLKYTAKLLTTSKKVGKKTIVTTNALPYSVYGKTTKAGLFTTTAKKKVGAFYETMKYRVLVLPKAPDTAVFGEELTNIVTMAYVPLGWDLTEGGSGRLGEAALPDGGRGATALPPVSNVAKVSGLPGGVTFAAKDTYAYKNAKQKTGKYLKQAGQTIVGTPTKPGTYVVTFTKNVKSGKKTVAKTAQMLWVVEPNDVEVELGFNDKGGVIENGVVGLKYGDLLAFSATSDATVTASGLPTGIKLVRVDGSAGGLALPGQAVWGFEGFTAKAGTYLVTVKATLNGRSVTQRLALEVKGLPAWAKGTFNGVVYATGETPVVPVGGDATGETPVVPEDAQAARSTNGLATVTVSSVGKISGKFQEFGTNWTFTAASYTARTRGSASLTGGAPSSATEGDAFICSNVVAKYAYKVTETVKGKKKSVTKYLERTFNMTVSPVPVVPDVADGPVRGVVRMEEVRLAEDGSPHQGSEVEAWQNQWGSTYKTVGKALFTSKSGKKTLAYKIFAIDVYTNDVGEVTFIQKSVDNVEKTGLTCFATLSLKVTTAGAVTATLTFDTGKTKKDPKTKKTVKVYYKPTCQSVVIPTVAPDAEPFAGEVPLYFAPSAGNGFEGFAGSVAVP